MRLADLLKSINYLTVSGAMDQDIQGLYYDSRLVKPGGLFFALRGTASDGRRFIDNAVKAGAVAVVVDEGFTPTGIPWVQVAEPRLAMSLMAAAFYGQPTASLPTVGITGTNGKTTITYLLEGILETCGLPPAVLGTVNYRFRGRVIPAPNTTPESVDLQRILRELVDLGARGVVMEVSSHALDQRRVDGCSFDVGIFTNLTRDHLDYHIDMESYFRSKARLFSELLAPGSTTFARRAVVNMDDPYGPHIAAVAACPVITYALEGNADVTAEDVSFSVSGICATLRTPIGTIPLRSELLGRFNLYNILAAVTAGIALELPLEGILLGIERHGKVPGRLEKVENTTGITLLVDYAHTGDALENVLRTLSELKTGRIITVFGCGGDRDRGKRPVMGEIAGEYSDLSIITSDNPRTEDPLRILSEVRAGIDALGLREYTPAELLGTVGARGFVTVENRREAIRLAVQAARPGDIVLLAGKGHEDYQVIGTEKQHFDDREEAAQAFLELKAEI